MRLTAKLPLIVVSAILFTVAAGSVLAILVGLRVLRETALADSAQRLEIYASAIEFYIESARSVLATTAREPELEDVAGSRRIAANILAASSVFEYVMLLRADGTVAMLEPRELEERLSHRDLSFSGWFAELASTGGPVVSDLHISPATQRPSVTLAFPLRDAAGRIRAVWAGALKLSKISEIGRTAASNASPMASGFVTDRRGLILAHQTQPRFVEQQTDYSSVPSVRTALAGAAGIGEVYNPIEGARTFSAYRPLPGLGWAVVYRVPVAVALSPVEVLTRGVAATSLALAALLGAGVFILARRMAAPLAQLAEAVRDVGRGDFSQRIQVASGDEVGQLAEQFNRMAAALAEQDAEIRKRTAELEAANRELESFSYSVSHDLRVPLRAVDGFSHMLERKFGGALGDEGRRLIGVVRESTKRMGRLIDDILEFSRMGRKELSRKRLDMTSLAREAARELELPRAGHHVELRIAELPAASGDAAMVKQVWANLLGNAVKFSRPARAPLVDVGGRAAEAGESLYFVKDNGVGFDMQYARKLFGVFQRLHGVDEFDGTGIGLAIVKRIVTRHGGRVWAEGKPGEGAIFYFTLSGGDPIRGPAPAPEHRALETTS